MTKWFIPANPKEYRLEDVLRELPHVDWRQHNNVQVGDIVYIYCSRPISQIKYKMRVTAVNITTERSTAAREYWVRPSEFDTSISHNKFFRMVLVDENTTQYLKYDDLEKHGLNTCRGGLKLKDPLLSYIESHFSDLYPNEITNTHGIYEGAVKSVLVNKYERNPIARQICLDKHGYNCSVCELNFEENYGEIGKNFIHVHHIIPISSIGNEYEIDPENDLVPVCPNCHAMLHKGKDGKVLAVEELKELLK